jgi:hypothetical protein
MKKISLLFVLNPAEISVIFKMKQFHVVPEKRENPISSTIFIHLEQSCILFLFSLHSRYVILLGCPARIGNG